MSLNPIDRETTTTQHVPAALTAVSPQIAAVSGSSAQTSLDTINNSMASIPSKHDVANKPECTSESESVPTANSEAPPGNIMRRWQPINQDAASPNYIAPRPQRQSRVMSALGHQAKFRHMKGAPLHKSLYFDNLKNLSRGMPGESDGFHVNRTFCAIPLDGPGGLIGILKLAEPGRLPDTGLPAIENGVKVTDFVWDPFDDHRLIAACDDAKIRVWRMPEGGITGRLCIPEFTLAVHQEKVNIVRCHPLARDVLVSSSVDMTVRIWDLAQQTEMLELQDHTDVVQSLSWSTDGMRCATVCKDGKIRVFEPRESPLPKLEGIGPAGARGARVLWVCEDKCLAVSGFDKMSSRKLYMYDSSDLSAPIHHITLDTSPAILIPFYDPDGNTLLLSGKGDRTVYTYELNPTAPHIFPLSVYHGVDMHQAYSFLPKCVCDVRKVEFARGYRLTASSLGPITFTVPRVKMEYFQDDLFPDTIVTWEPVMTSKEWFTNNDKPAKRISLCPSDMTPLSSAASEEAKTTKPVKPGSGSSYTAYREENKTDDEKKTQLLSAMTKKMDVHGDPLPQDLTEGVDDEEWDD